MKYINKPLLGVAVALLIVAVGAVTWLHATGTPTVGALAANPAYIVINTPTTVTFTISITDPSLLPTSVNLLQTDATGKTIATIGLMHDDGLNGDNAAGDRIFSYTLSLNQSTVGQSSYRTSAAFKGVLQRVLSNVSTVTIDPFKLPPDPGDEGKQTLEGIDSDHDGVRDDIQRFIALTENNATDRTILTSYTLDMQQGLVSSSDPAAVIAAANDRHKLAACWDYVHPADQRQALDELRVEILNTPDRFKAYTDADALLSGRELTLFDANAMACR